MSKYLNNRLMIFNKLIKTNYVVSVKSLQHFNTGNKLMERTPRNLKDCSRFLPAKSQKSAEDTEPAVETDSSFGLFQKKVQPVQTFSVGNVKRWVEYKTEILYTQKQKNDPEKVKIMGANLAAASFVIQWHGKVKFKNSDWLEGSRNKPIRLPSLYNPNYVVTAIDASKTLICYDGLENMSPLDKLKWLSFKSCQYINDWCLDRISARYPSLEYLDISDCINVTERGLEALYKLKNLKTLIITNHHKSASFELTCFMLEDCIPNLKCEIFNSWYKDKSKESNDKKKELE
ncbi:hypothetical protein M0802_011164 [Mischocyttarus mexicanus]|nr:hypothetical protein M0802_011164 [Mischocyttarus mexicanus]